MTYLPSYINPNPKKVSYVDLKDILRNIRERQRQQRRADRIALNEALASGLRTGPKY